MTFGPLWHPGRTHLTVLVVPFPGAVVCWNLAVSERPLHRSVCARSMTSPKGFCLSTFRLTSPPHDSLLTPEFPGATERDLLLRVTVSSQAPWSLCPLHFVGASVPLRVPFTVPIFVPRSALCATVPIDVRSVRRTLLVAPSFASVPSALALVRGTFPIVSRALRSPPVVFNCCPVWGPLQRRSWCACAVLHVERH